MFMEFVHCAWALEHLCVRKAKLTSVEVAVQGKVLSARTWDLRENATCMHSTICQPDDSHAFGRTFGGRPAREATDRRAQREPPWRQKFKLPPLRAERRRHLALVWENCGTRPTRHSRHPGDVPVGLDPQFSMSKKNNGRNPAELVPF